MVTGIQFYTNWLVEITTMVVQITTNVVVKITNTLVEITNVVVQRQGGGSWNYLPVGKYY